MHEREDKSVLGDEQLLELTQRFGQKSHLTEPRSVQKGKMTLLHQLLFWFVIKNVAP